MVSSFYLKLVKAEEMPSLVSRSSYSGRESMTGQHLREAESSDGAVSHDYDESGESEL